jgi:hypothetical protein
MAKISSLPSVDISTRSCGVTITTTATVTGDPIDQAIASVNIPVEYLPGIILLLQHELQKIKSGDYGADCHGTHCGCANAAAGVVEGAACGEEKARETADVRGIPLVAGC